MFVVDNISFAYNQDVSDDLPERLVLHNVSLRIAKGEWWSVVGANGSGKSTLARHLNGLLYPLRGRVLVDGLDTLEAANIQPIRRQVGIVFQNPDNQIIGNTVEEDVAFGPENLGVPPAEIRERVTEALGLVGLAGFEAADPNNLSGGQKQRVAIAGALALRPQALILDEATAMLDPHGCAEVFKVLGELHERGITILMITHNMSEVVMSDQVAVLNQGELMMTGTPVEVFAEREKLKGWGVELPIVNRLGERLLELGAADYLPERAAQLADCLNVAELVALLRRS